VLTAENMGSVQAVWRILAGKLPGIPKLGFPFVDVRDVVDLHIRAMTMPEAKGERFIASTQFLWMSEIAAILREGLGPRAPKVPTRTVPSIVIRLMSVFDRSLRRVTPNLGRRRQFSSAKAQRVLGWSPRPVEQSVLDCAESLIAKGAA